MPGAYTPTCHVKHLPGFLSQLDLIKSKGVSAVAVTAVNDIFTLDAWLKDSGAKEKLMGLLTALQFLQKLLVLNLI